MQFLLFIFFCLTFYTTASSAQINEFPKDWLTLKLFVEIPGYEIDIKSQSTNREVKFMPNTRALTGIGITLNGIIGGSVSAKASQTQEDQMAKGNTDYQDWRFYLSFKSFNLLLNYQEYKGFYINNSSDIDPSTPSGTFIQANEMKARNISANFTYVFDSKNFSFPATLDQTDRQESTGGSFLAGLAVNQNSISNDNLLIPSQVRSQFGNDQNTKSATFSTISAKIGYGLTLVANKRWFMSPLLAIGVGTQNSKYYDAIDEHSTNKTVWKSDIILTLGYNGDSFFSGITALSDATSYDTDSLKIGTNLWDVTLFVGTRF